MGMSIGVLHEKWVWIMKEAPTREKIVLGIDTREPPLRAIFRIALPAPSYTLPRMTSCDLVWTYNGHSTLPWRPVGKLRSEEDQRCQ